MVRARPILFAAAILALAAGEARAVDVVVGTGQPPSCTESALDAAVNSVRSVGGTITFNCGGATTIPITTEKHFYYNTNPNLTYTIDGGGLITLNAQGVTRHIRHFSGTLNIRNMTFTGGRAALLNYGTPYEEPSGGAIRSDRAFGTLVLNLTNVTFTGNSTNLTVAPNPPFSPFDYGGAAVFTRLGTLNVTNCTFTGNTANNTAGGAIHGRSSTINITGSTFASNSSNGGGFGGAINVDGVSPTGANGSLQVSTSSFTSNTTRNQGGALFFYLYPEKNESAVFNTISVTDNRVLDSSGTYLDTRAWGGGISGDRGNVYVYNSTVANNVAHSNTTGGTGGGIALISSGTVVISNSTISGNRAEGSNDYASGGGVVIVGNTQSFLIQHATIANNVAGWTGGGIQSLSNGTLTNTIVANNTANAFSFAQQCASRLTNGGGALQFPGFNAADPSDPGCANGVTVANPLLLPLAANGGFAPTHALGEGSPAIDTASCVVGTDQRGVSRPQGAGCDIGAFESRGPVAWYLRNSTTPGFPNIAMFYGAAGDVPVVGDWNGDGVDTIGIFRPSQGAFYLRNSNAPGFPDIAVSYGSAGDIPVVGDWNGDGVDTIGIFRPSQGAFYLRNSNTPGFPDIAVSYGSAGDIPVVGDWNGDGVDTIGIFRPSHGAFYLRNSNTPGFPDIAVSYGSAGDIPVVGDWNADGIETIGVFRPS